MKVLLATALLSLASAARADNPWAFFNRIPVVEIVTARDDGEPRVTKIWIAVANGRAFVSASRWAGWGDDLARDPQAHVRTADYDVAATARAVTESPNRALADDAYRAKYPTYALWSALGLAPSKLFELTAVPDPDAAP
jgi:hypothetical protein